jgi:DNA polymerase I-like protein with 3'-5' exonuclease and polymerase domains
MAKAYQAKDPQKLLQYNAMDCVVTARADSAMRKELTSNRQRALYEHCVALSKFAAKMHRTGFYVRQADRARLASELAADYVVKEKLVLDLVNIPGFRCTPNDIRALLFRRHETPGIKLFSLPDPHDEKCWSSKDTISVDFDSLLKLVTNPGVDPAAKAIIDAYWNAEEVKKARSTFITSELIDQAIGRDGRIRAGWNSLGADTGRFTCREPNLLTLPQKLRAMYGAPPGKVLVHADHSQQELRVMAMVAPDLELARRLETGDVYTEDTKDWFGLAKSATKDTIKKDVRNKAKIIHLASQYAAGTKTVYMQALAQDRTLTYKTVDILHKAFKKTYADTVRYWDEESERVAAAGYSESRIMGRRRYYPRMPEVTAIANYPIQSTAADLANTIALELDRRVSEVKGAALVCFFYDAVDVECFEEDAERVSGIVKECMEMPLRMTDGQILQVPCELKVSNNWAEL